MARFFHHALLLQARLDLNLTQEQAASAVGVDVRTYRRYESGAVNDARGGFSVRHPTRRRMLERLAAEFGLAEEDLLVEALPPGAPAPPEASGPSSEEPEQGLRPHFAHTLQRARHFVGRGEVLAFLSAWAAADAPAERVVTLVALGGTGKTAVAERLVASLGEGPRPGGTFVWSFYEDPRIEGFLSRALRYFAREEEVAPGERLERLQDVLGGGPPHLLVLDGLEVVQSDGGDGRSRGELLDPSLRRLLVALARGLGGARALMTSRFPVADLGAWEGNGLRTLALAPLSEDEGVDLLRLWGLRGGGGALRELSASTGGHALSVSMIGSYVGGFLGGDARRFEEVPLAEAARDDALARRLQAVLSAYARALPEQERDLLARLCVLGGGVDPEALQAIAQAGGALAGSLAGMGWPELRRTLARLERLGLVFAAREGQARYSTHPFLRDYFKSLLGVAPERIHTLERERLAARLDTRLHEPPRESARLDDYEALLLHTLRSGHAHEAYAIYARSLGGFTHLGLRLGDMSRGARVTAIFAPEGDPRRLSEALGESTRKELVYDWGLYMGALGQLDFAVRCYEASVALSERTQDAAGIVTGLRTLGYTERLRGRLTSARRLLERSVEVAGEYQARSHIARSAALLGLVLHELGEAEAADMHFSQARTLDGTPMARRALWQAEHDLALGRRERARAATRKNLRVCEHLGWHGHVAHCHTVLGLIAVEDDVAAAGEHLVQARVWARASNEVEMLLRCHELAARLALAEGRPEQARREAEEGLSLATACGFGLFRSRLACLVARSVLAREPQGGVDVALAALEATVSEDAWGQAEALELAEKALEATGQQARARELRAARAPRAR
ncbi:helix-turn-helix transcriptional regulator [Hyalangium rubrum]|uniref:Helix-turn-helix transcriptional regulator n=1 Tax=Hyalangium rubrum TaxID=3103134 RepID=A0ABU5H1N7_9BACT|nr:helix-turn-helix transcriptional regulator [Hyalangium sp. s54d21]MDY7226678.1 helix-turn-helix transcriptional regulator [Hyalangium sp. s54d21]